jgi:hypothetical protein
MTRQQIIDKIQKLLALANSSNENEAKSAAAMAQALLTKYNLTMTDIELEPGEEKYQSEYVQTDRERQDPAWKFVQSLLRDFFFVEIVQSKKRVEMNEGDGVMYWKNTKTVHCYIMFGQSHNIIIAKYVRDFLMRAFPDSFKSYRARTGAPATSRHSYYYGLFAGLFEQLKAARGKVEQEVGLVVVQDAGLMEFIKDELGNVKEKKQSSNVGNDQKALQAGYEEGKNLKIAMGLDGRKDEKKQVGETLKLGTSNA